MAQKLPSAMRSSKLSNFVYEALCKSIVEGELVAGQRLREAEVAESLGVSRTPVREALTKLESQHLLYRLPGGAYFVAKWNKQNLWEVATLRGALEGLAISLAAQNLRPEDFDYLEGIIAQMESAKKRADYHQLILLDIQFHSYIWSCAGHTLLSEALEQLKPQVRYFMIITRPGDEESYPETHRVLLETLKKRDPIKAKEAIQEHALLTAEHAIGRLVVE
jgi:DNA-binding GntR family transcriptional regulator